MNNQMQQIQAKIAHLSDYKKTLLEEVGKVNLELDMLLQKRREASSGV